MNIAKVKSKKHFLKNNYLKQKKAKYKKTLNSDEKPQKYNIKIKGNGIVISLAYNRIIDEQKYINKQS